MSILCWNIIATILGPAAALSSSDDNAKNAASVKASIADVAWIAGHWSMRLEGDLLDEHWSKPEGDCMMGMFRWIKSGEVWIYEFLSIRHEDGTLVLRFRHLGNDLTTWEPKTEPLTYRLSSLSDNEAVFENLQSESHRLFAFKRDGNESLTVRVGAIHDGKLATTEFHYKRR